MKKKLIIFLSEIKIRKYDILRFDLEELQSVYGYKIEIHELIEHIYPGFSFMFTNTYEDKRIKRFNYFNEWKERILFLKKNLNENIFILNQVSLHDFKGLKINYFLKKNNFKTLTFRNITFSTYQLDRNLKDFFSTVKNKSLTLNKIKNFVKKKILLFIGKKLKLSSNYSVVCGEKDMLSIKNNKLTKIILGNSFDYNMYLKYKNINYLKKNNYALFLESPAPAYNLGDSYIIKNNFVGTKQKWLNSINNFFDFVEKELKIKVLIAPHPKIKHSEKFSNLYNGREVVEDGLYQTSKNAKIIISRDSTGFAYAAIYKIPAIFIYTNELLKNKIFLNQQKCFASCLGLKPINIDKDISKKNLDELLKFNKNTYGNYVRNYLTTRKDEKKNFEIINESAIKKIL